MLQLVWAWFATPGASVLAGVLSVAVLISMNRHRDAYKKTAPGKIAQALLMGAAVYTFALIIIGDFTIGVPVSVAVKDHFGDGRALWALIGVTADLFARYYAIYDPA